MKKYIIILIFSVFFMWSTYPENSELNYCNYKEVLNALLSISAIIFAIIGAWIAIIYPKAIGVTFNSNVSVENINDSEKDTNYLSELVEIVLVSAVVLMFVLSIQFLFPIMRASNYFGINVKYVKIVSFFSVSSLTFIQLWAIFRVILAIYFFLNELRRKNNKRKVGKLH